MEPARYRRLPGRGHTGPLPRWGLVLLAFIMGPLVLLVRGARQELWEGDDHLLILERNGFSERYRQFSYADIQAIQRWRTLDYFVTSLILAAVMGGLTLLAV